jgi:hypothetical protein
MKHRNDFPLTVSFINTPIIILLYAWLDNFIINDQAIKMEDCDHVKFGQ